ncbi:unnamed protein product [Symbiodinium natans]|uniref:Uncharacterized protein n=1 Tax=Symbiodinium natans TaxID=878477 RepID=A0A812QTK4_9DINO|nr:unnamed protein product [Symbiodinium natans]
MASKGGYEHTAADDELLTNALLEESSQGEGDDETDASSTDTEQEGEQSPDHQESKDKDADDKNDDGEGSTAVLSQAAGSSSTEPSVEVSKDMLMKHIINIMKDAKTKEDYEEAQKKLTILTKTAYDAMMKTKATIRAIEKDEKKKLSKDKKEKDRKKAAEEHRELLASPVNVNVAIGSEVFIVTLTNEDTVGELRKRVIKILRDLNRKTNVKGKISTSDVILLMGDVCLTEAPRKTLLKAAVKDGAKVIAKPTIRGGGKRATSGSAKVPFDDKVSELREEINLHLMMLKIAPTPLTAEATKLIEAMLKKVLTNPDELDNILKANTIENLKRVQSLTSASNLDSKVGGISKVLFDGIYNRLLENQKQILTTEKALKALFHLSAVMKYSSCELPVIQWGLMGSDVVELIATKSREAGTRNMEV